MIRTVTALRRRLHVMGFEGPAYSGLRGRTRFILESALWREEVVLVATRASFEAVGEPAGPALELIAIDRYEDLDRFRDELEERYYPGYVDAWRGPFDWGERAVIGRLDGNVASFNFFQLGSCTGHPTYWGRLLAGQARVLRGGVIPKYRHRGLNRIMKWQLLRTFFQSGTNQVFAECYSSNTPSLKALLAVGFRPIGSLTVVAAFPFKNFVRWRRVDPSVGRLAETREDV